MAQILVTQTKDSPYISTDLAADKLINLYPTIRRESMQSPLPLLPAPGHTQFASQGGASAVRGCDGFPEDSVSYWVIDNKAYTLSTGGTLTEIGTLTASSGRVFVAIGETYGMILDPADSKGYTFTRASPAASFAAIADAQFTALDTFTGLQHIDGYFVITANETASGISTFALSDLDNPTSWTTSLQGSAEAVPDALNGLAICNRSWFFFGTITTEVYANTGKSGLPISRQAYRDIGCAAKFSIVNVDGVAYFLARSRTNKAFFARTNGYDIAPIGNEDLDAFLHANTVSDCIAHAVSLAGQVFIYFSFPTANKTIVFCPKTEFFFEAQDASANRHISSCALSFNNKVYIGSRSSGQIFEIDTDIYTENGTNMVRTIILPTIFSNNAYISIAQLIAYLNSNDFSTTQTISASASYDGGNNYNTVLTDTVTADVDYAVWYQLTAAKRVTIKITYTGSKRFEINNIIANMTVEGGD